MTKEQLIADAAEMKASGKYNCAQAVACAFAPAVNMDAELVKRMTNSFGTGMGCLEATCGAIVGAGVIIGLASADRVTAMRTSAGVIQKFNERNGATICGRLKGIEHRPARPLRPCTLCVTDAAEFLADALHID